MLRLLVVGRRWPSRLFDLCWQTTDHEVSASPLYLQLKEITKRIMLSNLKLLPCGKAEILMSLVDHRIILLKCLCKDVRHSTFAQSEEECIYLSQHSNCPWCGVKVHKPCKHLQLLQDVDTIGTLRRMRTKWRRQDSTYNRVSNVADLLLLVRLFRTVAYSCLCVGIFYFSSIKFQSVICNDLL